MANTAVAGAVKPGVTPDPKDDKEPLDGQTPDTGADDDEDDAEPQGDLRAALREERGKRKAAAKRAADAESKIKEMQPMVDEYGQLLPILPGLLAGAKKPTPQQVAESDAAEVAKLTKVAEAFGFEDENGQPDLKRAKAAQGLINATASEQAAAAAAPARRDAAQVAAASILEKAYKATDPDGNLYAKKEFIDKVFGNIPAEALNAETAAMALVMARGLGGPGDAPQTEPVFTEASGRRAASAPVLTDMDKKIAKLRGRSDKEWAKNLEDPNEKGWELE